MKPFFNRLFFVIFITVGTSMAAWSNDYIEIANATDLQKIGHDEAYPLNGHYILMSDIDLEQVDDWIPIGSLDANDKNPRNFDGVLNGNGYSIKNLTITTSTNFRGLFGRLYHAVVKDLDLVDVDIKGTSPIGGITGAMMAGSRIERVSVSGNIEGQTEVGGIAGRIARDGDKYNIIEDCYVSATITATNLSTSMDTPSCAGGIAAYTHSTSGSNYAKIDIHRTYFTGTVRSTQMNHVAGNAAGILAFYDNHKFVKMNEVLVLADEITAATPNLFFGRRGPTYADFEQFEKVFARDDIPLSYLNTNDKGRGGEIPDGVIHYNPLETYKTKAFYDENLSWDFEDVWTITEGSLPVLKRVHGPISQNIDPKASDNCKISVKSGVLEIEPYTTISVYVFDMTGSKVYTAEHVSSKILVDKLPEGIYVVQTQDELVKNIEKVWLR